MSREPRRMVEPLAKLLKRRQGVQEEAKPEAEESPDAATSKPERKMLYLDPEVVEVVSQILSARRGQKSAYTGRKLREHDLYLEAIDLLLEKYGETSIAQLRADKDDNS